MAGRPKSTRTAPSEPGVPGHLAGNVQALERGLHLLTVIAEADGLSLTSIAQRAGIAPSTAHRILHTLKAGGFVQYDDARGGYLIGVQAFRTGSAFLRNRKLADVGRGTMRALMEASGETVNMGIEIEGHVVFISQVESHQSIRAFHRPGARGPMHASSLGKAIMASLSEADISQRLHRVGLTKYTAHTIVDPQALLADLALVRRRGWAVDDEEQAEGLRCVGAPVYNEHGEVIGAISVSGPTVRMTDERLGELGPMVKRAAAEITEKVGGRLPAPR
jgi:IclR family transcriptional regulator, acetate operon repressor